MEFLQAGKPREAIDMFVHQKAWADACRVAEGHDPPAVSDVLCAQAADVAAAGDRAAAEDLYVRAAKPEKALQVRPRSPACNGGYLSVKDRSA